MTPLYSGFWGCKRQAITTMKLIARRTLLSIGKIFEQPHWKIKTTPFETGCWEHSKITARRNTGGSNNPFDVLGIPKSSSFDTVKRRFIELALQHHPDTSESGKANADYFVRIRQSFELIRKGNGGGDDEDSSPPFEQWTESDFLQWFHQQTGIKLSSSQRRALAEIHRSRIPGGKYDGPSWELARRLVDEQDAFFRQMQKGGPPPNKESSNSKSESVDTSSLRRKRRR
jgi:hypothetical protein